MMQPDPNDRPVVKIEKDKWFFKNKDSVDFKEAGKFILDVATTPKCVDLISTAKESEGQKNEAIYKLEEDKLTIVLNLNADDKSRPMDFKTADKPGMILVVLGLILVFKSLRTQGSRISIPTIKPLVIVLGSVVLFGLTVVPLGLVLATILLIVVASTASHEFRWKEALIASVLLAGFVVVAFHYGLQLQLPTWPAFISGN